MSQPSINPVSTVRRSASWFMTGSAPGKPRQVGQVLEFGAAPNSTGQAQNIFERVLSWTWTSRPMEGRYISDCGYRKPESYFERRAVRIDATTMDKI
jgi:hypothetical protein